MRGEEGQLEEQVEIDSEEEHQKDRMVLSTYTIVDPRTMMVIDRDTPLTELTMFRSRRFKYLTIRTQFR
jgi:hypothetical protein